MYPLYQRGPSADSLGAVLWYHLLHREDSWEVEIVVMSRCTPSRRQYPDQVGSIAPAYNDILSLRDICIAQIDQTLLKEEAPHCKLGRGVHLLMTTILTFPEFALNQVGTKVRPQKRLHMCFLIVRLDIPCIALYMKFIEVIFLRLHEGSKRESKSTFDMSSLIRDPQPKRTTSTGSASSSSKVSKDLPGYIYSFVPQYGLSSSRPLIITVFRTHIISWRLKTPPNARKISLKQKGALDPFLHLDICAGFTK